jgi:hypothetical protein
MLGNLDGRLGWFGSTAEKLASNASKQDEEEPPESATITFGDFGIIFIFIKLFLNR